MAKLFAKVLHNHCDRLFCFCDCYSRHVYMLRRGETSIGRLTRRRAIARISRSVDKRANARPLPLDHLPELWPNKFAARGTVR